MTLGNLEGTLSVGGASKCGGIGGGNCFAFQAPPSTAALSCAALGFDLVNHGQQPLARLRRLGPRQTISALDAGRIAHTGLPGEITFLRSGGGGSRSSASRRTPSTATCSISRPPGRWSDARADRPRSSS